MRGFLHFTAWNSTKYNKCYERFSLPMMSNYWFVKSVSLIRQTTWLATLTKSISKIFIPNFVCVLTNKRFKTYQIGFSFYRLGHAPGVGLWGTGGSKTLAWGFAMVSHRLRILVFCFAIILLRKRKLVTLLWHLAGVCPQCMANTWALHYENINIPAIPPPQGGIGCKLLVL